VVAVLNKRRRDRARAAEDGDVEGDLEATEDADDDAEGA
jgi:hypothetical protein